MKVGLLSTSSVLPLTPVSHSTPPLWYWRSTHLQQSSSTLPPFCFLRCWCWRAVPVLCSRDMSPTSHLSHHPPAMELSSWHAQQWQSVAGQTTQNEEHASPRGSTSQLAGTYIRDVSAFSQAMLKSLLFQGMYPNFAQQDQRQNSEIAEMKILCTVEVCIFKQIFVNNLILWI